MRFGVEQTQRIILDICDPDTLHRDLTQIAIICQKPRNRISWRIKFKIIIEPHEMKIIG